MRRSGPTSRVARRMRRGDPPDVNVGRPNASPRRWSRSPSSGYVSASRPANSACSPGVIVLTPRTTAPTASNSATMSRKTQDSEVHPYAPGSAIHPSLNGAAGEVHVPGRIHPVAAAFARGLGAMVFAPGSRGAATDFVRHARPRARARAPLASGGHRERPRNDVGCRRISADVGVLVTVLSPAAMAAEARGVARWALE